MATFLAHITVVDGGEARFEEIARELFAQTHAREDGVRLYDYWRAAAPRHYYALGSWDDHRTFVSHQTSDHHETASPQLGAVVESLQLEWVDPVAGASTLVPTDHQEAPEDADELTARYTRWFRADVADWWLSLR